MRSRTTSESSCGSQWMSEAPSSAAWKMTELTRRTSGASEMPSSTSRSSASSTSSSWMQLLFLERGPGAEGLGRADEPPDLGLDVVARRDGELDGEPRRDAQLVDRVDVARIGDGDAQHVAVDRVRDRVDALEHVERNLLRRLGSTPVFARSISGSW